jgi:23S rRNA pseudouridine1911/1915/1917 synthase
MLPKGKRRQSVKAEYRKVRTEVEEQKVRDAALRAEQNLPDAEPEHGGESYYDVEEMMYEAPPDPSNPYLRVINPIGTRNEMQHVAERRYVGLQAPSKVAPEIPVLDDLEPEDGVRTLTVPAEAKDMRIDAYLAKALPDISRGRVQLLIDRGQVSLNGEPAKSKIKLRGGETIEIEGEPAPEPLRATPEDIPLAIVYEDDDLAVIDKPAGMTVHAGAGSAEHNRGTLVNALLFHFGKTLANADDSVRPGIVHRLDKDTSGLLVVAKNDSTHRKLAEMFATRSLRKVYLALAHGWLVNESGTVDLPIARDLHRRMRMTTRRSGGRNAITHYKVLERLTTPYGKFTLVELHIETGRTHQIRVHLQSLGHPVVGDTMYGAHGTLRSAEGDELVPERNFLHAAELDFKHPQTDEKLEMRAELPAQLVEFLDRLRSGRQ